MVTLVEGIPSPAPLATGGTSECFGSRDVGRAMRTTPRKEIMAAICSLRVNGSSRRMNEQAQQATIGARKVMTVASLSGRYWSESLTY